MYLFRGMNRPVLGQVKGDLEREPGPVNLRQLENTKRRHFYVLQTLFWVRDILGQIQILLSVHWITDTDPVLFVSGFQETSKKYVFFLLFISCKVQLYISHCVTKKCRLSLLTNSALVYEPKCRGRGGVAGSHLYTGAQLWRSNSIFNL
jgi:hypothetical protein